MAAQQAIKETKMKLYNILFEQAKTAEEAIQSDYGLFVYTVENDLAVALIDTERCQSIIESYLSKKGNLPVKKTEPVQAEPAPSPLPPLQTGPYDPNVPPWELNEAYESASVKIDWLIEAIGNRAIVGAVGARQSTEDTWRVAYSVAVQKYGPLLYDVAMASVYPAYLCSDYDLTADSQRVWNKMLARNDVEKIPVTELGDDAWSMVNTSFNVAGLTSEAAQKASESMEDQELDLKWFENFVNSLPPEDKAKLGPFYGFRRKAGKNLSKYNTLLKASEEIIDMLAGTMKLKRADVEDAIEQAAINMFKRFYYRKESNS